MGIVHIGQAPCVFRRFDEPARDVKHVGIAALAGCRRHARFKNTCEGAVLGCFVRIAGWGARGNGGGQCLKRA
jgi:hypothetical protein